MVKFFRRSSAKKGIPAGTAIYIGETDPLPTQINFVQFDENKHPIISTLDSVNLAEKILRLSNNGGWLHIAGLANTEIIQVICETLSIDPLITEDILNTKQLSKIEIFSGYTLVITRLPSTINSLNPVTFEQISFILKENLLITFQENHNLLIDQMATYLQYFINKKLKLDNAHLLYFVLDMIIDEHLAIVEQKGENLEALEEKVMQMQEDIEFNSIYLLKRDMLHLRKNIMGLHNIITLLLYEHKAILPQLAPIYLRDLLDHAKRIIEVIDIHRELGKNIIDIYISSINTKSNETMRLLTVYTAIFIPLTFVTGFYGMNFPIPELEWKYGYFFAIGLIAVIAVSLLVYFRRKKWI